MPILSAAVLGGIECLWGTLIGAVGRHRRPGAPAAAGLDEAEAREMLATVRRMAPDAAVLLVEHNRHVIESADRVVVLHDGRVLAQGHPHDVLDDPAVREIYSGDRPAARTAM